VQIRPSSTGLMQDRGGEFLRPFFYQADEGRIGIIIDALPATQSALMQAPRPPAIDIEYLAGDIAGGIGYEEAHHGGNLLRVAGPP